jgi:hypothetical protein
MNETGYKNWLRQQGQVDETIIEDSVKRLKRIEVIDGNIDNILSTVNGLDAITENIGSSVPPNIYKTRGDIELGKAALRIAAENYFKYLSS